MLNIANTRFGRPLILRSADKGSSGGNGSDNKPTGLTPEQQLTKTRDDLTAVTSERDQLKSQVSSLTSERDQLKSQFDSLTQTASKTKEDLTAAQSQISTLTSERDQARTDLQTSNGHKSRLEQLCAVKGIDTNATPPTPPESKGAKLTYAQWDAKVSAAKPGKERDEVMASFEAAVKAGDIASN